MSQDNVIVTGGAGFIGSNLCKSLSLKGYNPISIDNLSTGFRELVKYGELVCADIGDYNKVCEVLKKYKPLAVFHIAGSKSVEESIRMPFKYYDNNVARTNILLKAMVDCGVANIIFSSTAAIFGLPEEGVKLVDENHSTNPINPYGTSKLMVEKILESYDASHHLKYSALRYFNVTGADPDVEMGEIAKSPTNIFPVLLEVIDKKRNEFVIFGDDYSTEDGSCVRDYIHVSDLVDAHVKAFEKQLEANSKSVKINLGNGSGFSVKQVIDLFKKTTGADFKVRIGERRAGDPDLVIANNKFANEYLKWYPQYSNLEDHVSHSWKWYLKNKSSQL